MKKKNLILRLSNELGNQLFMYAAGFCFAKKLNRNFFIDNETAFKLKKNISTYNLDEFLINKSIAPNEFKFLKLKGYLKRKFLLKFNKIKKIKNFYIEHKSKEKITYFNEDFLNNAYDENLFIEGHFESERYFQDFKNEIINQFNFKNKDFYSKNKFFDEITNSNSVSICIRQNRFSEKIRNINHSDIKKSREYSLEQVRYIKKSIKIIKNKITNPKFFLWSNNFDGLNEFFPESNFVHVKNLSTLEIGNKPLLDLFLMTQAKHFIVVPSSFNWWGAYLSKNQNKVIIRPDDKNFSNFKINNQDFWPETWMKI
jgi:hypothetical protein